MRVPALRPAIYTHGPRTTHTRPAGRPRLREQGAARGPTASDQRSGPLGSQPRESHAGGYSGPVPVREPLRNGPGGGRGTAPVPTRGTAPERRARSRRPRGTVTAGPENRPRAWSAGSPGGTGGTGGTERAEQAERNEVPRAEQAEQAERNERNRRNGTRFPGRNAAGARNGTSGTSGTGGTERGSPGGTAERAERRNVAGARSGPRVVRLDGPTWPPPQHRGPPRVATRSPRGRSARPSASSWTWFPRGPLVAIRGTRFPVPVARVDEVRQRVSVELTAARSGSRVAPAGPRTGPRGCDSRGRSAPVRVATGVTLCYWPVCAAY